MLPSYLKSKDEELLHFADFNGCLSGESVLPGTLVICLIVSRIVDSNLLHEQS